MNQDPLNPYQHHDKASDDDLKKNLKKKLFEHESYKLWAERAEEEIIYIKKIIGSRVK